MKQTAMKQTAKPPPVTGAPCGSTAISGRTWRIRDLRWRVIADLLNPDMQPEARKAKQDALRSYGKIIKAMEASPQPDAETVPAEMLPRPKRAPTVPPDPDYDRGMLERLTKLLNKDTGWEPAQSGYPSAGYSPAHHIAVGPNRPHYYNYQPKRSRGAIPGQ